MVRVNTHKIRFGFLDTPNRRKIEKKWRRKGMGKEGGSREDPGY